MFDQVLREVGSARASLQAAARNLDARALSGANAVTLLEELGAVRRLADGMVARAAKRVDDTAAHTYDGKDRNAAELTARVVGMSSGEARRAIGTAAKLGSLPATDAAVRAGRISAQQAELITAAAADDPSAEAELLRAAGKGMVPLRDAAIAARARTEDQTARRARQRNARFHRSWTTAEGMLAGSYQVPPEEGAAMKVRLDAETRRIFRAHRTSGEHEPQEAYAADALVEAVTGTRVDGGEGDGAAVASARRSSKPVGYTVHIMVDHDALTRGEVVDGETCEIPGVGPVSVEWVREILGTAFVTAIIRKGKDVRTVAHFGRHIPVELMTALLVAGRECVVEGCSGRAYLEVDHCEIDYAQQGPTALWNLAFECWTHHRLKTQGWQLGPPDPVTGKRRLDPPAGGRAA